MFKAGDLVIRTGETWYRVEEGKVYTVVECTDILLLEGIPGSYSIELFALYKRTPKVTGGYTFKVSSESAIRLDELPLSFKEPIIVIWVNKRPIVGIHTSILEKLMVLDSKTPKKCVLAHRLDQLVLRSPKQYKGTNTVFYTLQDVKDIEEFVSVVKEIYHAAWPGEEATVRVVPVKI